MIGHHQRRTTARDARHTDFDPKPCTKKNRSKRSHDGAVEVRSNSEFVDAVVTGQALSEKSSNRGDELRALGVASVDEVVAPSSAGVRRFRTTAAICSADARSLTDSNDGCCRDSAR